MPTNAMCLAAEMRTINKQKLIAILILTELTSNQDIID